MTEEMRELGSTILDIIENDETFEYPTYPDAQSVVIADAVLKLGYHKTVWHKVEDGDLPEKSGWYWCYCDYVFNEDEHKRCYDLNCWRSDDQQFILREGKSVIAWTELPIYKE